MKGRLRKLFFRGVEPVPGNRLRLLQGGADFFPALIVAIDAAHAIEFSKSIGKPRPYVFQADGHESPRR